MSDPKRWSETDDVNDDVRQLVTTLSNVEPTAAMRESVWAKVAATLPAGPGSGGPSDGGGAGGAGGGGGATAPALGTGAKLLAAAALTAGALSLWILTRPNASPVTAPAPIATPTSIATALEPTESASAAPAPTAIPIPTATATLAAPARSSSILPKPIASTASPTAAPTLAADRLREEAEGVKRARQLLRDKNTAAALTELDRLARLFPNGPLEEEREVLTIEALVGSSSSAELGRRRAERFLAERPQSVHAARVRGLAGR